MYQLNLPKFEFTIKQSKNGLVILDTYRKRYVKLTPEEWVRQNFLRFFTETKSFPATLLAVETQLSVNGMNKRCDGIFYDKKGRPIIILEFKAPTIPINQQVFDQASVYNTKLGVDFFILSNGIQHIISRVNQENKSFEFLEEIPNYDDFMKMIK